MSFVLSVVLALLLLLSEIAHDMHEISPDNVNRQSREEVVRSNGMISRGKLSKCSQVVPPEMNERCNFERLSFADHCPVRDGKLLRMVPQARQVLSRVAKWAELLVGGMAGHCLCRGEGVTYTSSRVKMLTLQWSVSIPDNWTSQNTKQYYRITE